MVRSPSVSGVPYSDYFLQSLMQVCTILQQSWHQKRHQNQRQRRPSAAACWLVFAALYLQPLQAEPGRQQFEQDYASQPLAQLIAGINDRDRLAHLALSHRLSEGRGDSPINQSSALAHYNTAARMGVPGSSALSGYGLPVIRAQRGSSSGVLPCLLYTSPSPRDS